MEATEDTLLEIIGHLPGEAAEALLNLATGIRPPLPVPVATGTDPFEHPDALRRFRVMKNVEELALALDYPWERWAVFLHPAQRALVEKDFKGPARVSGSPVRARRLLPCIALRIWRARTGSQGYF